MNQPSNAQSTPNRPLVGVQVLVTRPGNEPDSLSVELKNEGAEVIRCPLILFSEPENGDEIRQFREHLDDFSLLVFLSPRAVSAAEKYFLAAVNRIPPIAAIGEGTAKCLTSLGYEVSMVPEESNSVSMAKLLVAKFEAGRHTKPILILRANRGSEVLPTALQKAQVPFKSLAVYQSHDVTEVDAGVTQRLSNGECDWITLTSSSIARNAAKVFGQDLGATKIVSISPTTSKAAIEAGLSVTAEATEYNNRGLVEAILNHHRER